MILVDTSVFIDFFRGKPTTELERLLRQDLVALSTLVRLELIQGLRRNEAHALNRLLSGLREVPIDRETWRLAEQILWDIKGEGLTLGIPDLLLAAQAQQTGFPVLSLDKVFQRLGVAAR